MLRRTRCRRAAIMGSGGARGGRPGLSSEYPPIVDQEHEGREPLASGMGRTSEIRRLRSGNYVTQRMHRPAPSG